MPDGLTKVDEDHIFSVVPSDRKRGNGHKLKYGKLHLSITKNFFIVRFVKHWNRFPREAVQSPVLNISQTHLDPVLCNLL